MNDPEKENDYFVRLSGKGNIPEPLHIGQNYKLQASGTIVSFTETDKNDGSHVIYYKFEPIVVEFIDDLGKAIRAKDTRSLSQLFRARVWKNWSKLSTMISFEEYYENLMQNLIQMADEVVELYGTEEK